MITITLDLCPIDNSGLNIVRLQSISDTLLDKNLFIPRDLPEYIEQTWRNSEKTVQLTQSSNEGLPSEQALTFYYSKLRSELEPKYNGQYVAIHADTFEYIVDKGLGRAFRALRKKQPNGPIIVRHIGIADDNLKSRIRGTQP